MTLQRLSNRCRLITALALATIGLYSCGNNGCEQTRESYFCAAVKQTDDRLSIQELSIWGIGQQGERALRTTYIYTETDTMIVKDSVWVDELLTKYSKPSELELILRPDTTFSQFRLRSKISHYGDISEVTDTLSISYRPYTYFLDMECGCSVFFDIDSVSITHNLFKRVSIQNSTISNEENVNITLEY